MKPSENVTASTSGAKPAVTSRTIRILFLASAFCVAYFGLTILLLSLLTNSYSPISQVASDYGVGAFALEMNLGFVVGGIGFVAFAIASFFLRRTKQTSIAGAIILLVDGLVLATDGYFNTDVEGAPHTFHGLVHGFGGAIFFFSAPFGILLVSYRLGRRSRFLLTLLALIVGIIFEIANSALSLNAGGLAERVLLLIIFSSAIAASLSLYKGAEVKFAKLRENRSKL